MTEPLSTLCSGELKKLGTQCTYSMVGIMIMYFKTDPIWLIYHALGYAGGKKISADCGSADHHYNDVNFR